MMLLLSLVLLEGAGGRAGEPVRSHRALGQHGAALAQTVLAVTSCGKLCKAGEENTLKVYLSAQSCPVSVCHPLRAGLAPGGPLGRCPWSLLSREDGNVPLTLLAAYGS